MSEEESGTRLSVDGAEWALFLWRLVDGFVDFLLSMTFFHAFLVAGVLLWSRKNVYRRAIAVGLIVADVSITAYLFVARI